MINKFEEFIQELGGLETKKPQEFELQAIKLFNEYLTGEDSAIYHEPAFQKYGKTFFADAMVSKSRDDKPIFIIEVKDIDKEYNSKYENAIIRQITTFIDVSGAEYGVLLSNQIFSIISEETKLDIDLEDPEDANITEAKNILQSVEFSDEERESYNEKLAEPIDTQYFSLDIEKLEQKISQLNEATTNHQKGEKFEELAALLFGGIDFLTVRDKQLRTNTGEIDVVVEYDGSKEKTIFDEYSRFILAECKNWSGSVGVPQIRDFKGKMEKSYTNFGVIFAREGISGDEGTDAIRWIHDYFQREGSVILVIDDDEIARIRSGESFYEILDDLLYQRRFDLST